MRQSQSNRGGCICADYVVHGSQLIAERSACIEFDEEGIILGVGSSRSAARPCAAVPGYIMPPLCNAHVHALDYLLAEAGEDKRLEELVAHPYGLKYRLLSASSLERLEGSAKTLAARMQDDGTLYAGIYAELGRVGASIIAGVMGMHGLRVRVLAQPYSKSFAEYMALLEEYGGVGLDTVFDLTVGDLKLLSMEARSKGFHVHVHVSETVELRDMKDLELVAEAKPSAAIHLTHAKPDEVLQLALEGVAPVFCPRSNAFHGVGRPPLTVLVDLMQHDLPVGLGTDNAGWLTPSIAEEASYTYLEWRDAMRGRLEEFARSILYAVTVGCARLLGFRPELLEDSGTVALAVAMPEARYTANPIITLVKRMSYSYRSLITLSPSKSLAEEA